MLVNEIFNSIDGEVSGFGQGMLTTFIRLQGCNLRCAYCDTKKAQDKALFPLKMTPSQIVGKVNDEFCGKLTITGGEPLEQRKELIRLINQLRANFGQETRISVETNGSKSLAEISHLASWVVDFKTPSSGMYNANNLEAFEHLNSKDAVKFVIKDRKDFDTSRDFIRELWGGLCSYEDAPLFAFSPVFDCNGKPFIKPRVLLDLLNETYLPKRFRIALSVQLHKIIGLP